MPSDQLATKDDVVTCYEVFLGRKPESDTVVDQALIDSPSLWTLVDRFHCAPEALRRQEILAAIRIHQDQDPRGIDLTVDSDQFARLVAHIRDVWAKYGEQEAYYSVLTNPKFLRANITAHEIEAFYASGEVGVAEVETVFARNGLAIDPSGTILELGCGVGRMGEAFRRRTGRYIGVDISAGHLALARERLSVRGLHDIHLMQLEEFVLQPIAYDLFYSGIVLQHNPPPVIANLLDICLRRLRPGGLAYFQLPCFLYDYQFSTSAYLRGEGRKTEMEMHALPQRVVFQLLHKNGLEPVEVMLDPQIGPIGHSYSFLARKPHFPSAGNALAEAASSLAPWAIV